MRAKVVGQVLPGLLALVAAPAPAFAEDGAPAPPRYVLSSVRGDGAEGCPGAEDLAREVERRLGRAVFDRSAPRSIEVHLHRSGPGYRSEVFVRDAEHRTLGRRELSSDEASCGALFSATALALALLIDPDAVLSDERAPAVARFDAAAGAEAASAVAPSTPPAPAPLVRDARARRPSPWPAVSGVASLRASGVVAFEAVPGATPGVELGFASRPGGGAWGGEIGALYLVARATEPSASADFSFGLTALGLSVTYDFLDAGPVVIAGVFGPWVGALHSVVRAPEPRDPGDYLYLALAAGLRARFPLVQGWFTQASAGLRLPLVRSGFFVNRAPEPAWRQPPLSAELGLGVGVELL